MTHADVVRLLQDRVDKAESLRGWCREHRVQAATVSRILNGKLPLQQAVLDALRLARVISYRRTT